MTKSYWKMFSELMSAHRVASTFLLSKMLTFPETTSYQLDVDVFLECLISPEKPIGNVLIIQGGIKHLNRDSYYVKTVCGLISDKSRVFLYEKLLPMVNFDYAEDIEICLKFIRTNFPGKIVVIGYSMGGILLYKYLSLGYDSADLYIPTCCPLNLTKFQNNIDDNLLFRIIQWKARMDFGVNTNQELFDMSHTNFDQQTKHINCFISKLNSQAFKWVPKTIYILSKLDPLTIDYQNELKLLTNLPIIYLVDRGWHCCLNALHLSVKLTTRYLIESENDPNFQIKSLKI